MQRIIETIKRYPIWLLAGAAMPVVVPTIFALLLPAFAPVHQPWTPGNSGRKIDDAPDRTLGVPATVNYLSGMPFRKATVTGDIYWYSVQGRDGRLLLQRKADSLQNQMVVVRGCIKKGSPVNVAYCEVSLNRTAYLEKGGVMPLNKLVISFEDRRGIELSMTECELVGADANAKEYCP